MPEEFKNALKIASIYAGTIIGAGFASGQEIMQFFSAYRTGGFFGVLLAGALFSVVGCIVLEKVYSQRIRNYEEFIFPMFGWKLGWIVKTAVTLFVFCMFCIMTAGAGNVISENFGLPIKYSVLVMAFISMLLTMTNIKGIVLLNSIITPVMVIGIILSGLCMIIFKESPASGLFGIISKVTNNWFASSLLYVSYNSILGIVMLCGMLPYIKSRRTAIAGGILGGVSLTAAAIVINAVITLFYPSAMQKELPVMEIIKSFSSSAGGFYSILLWFAMLTSGVASGYSFSERVGSALRVDKRIVAVLLSCAAVPLSALGFSRLIALIYPAFGYLGLFMIIVILITEFIKPSGFTHYHSSKTGR
jgi:uncharacterized membrane protein YkvI